MTSAPDKTARHAARPATQPAPGSTGRVTRVLAPLYMPAGRAVWHRLPPSVRGKLQTDAGKRFTRFVPVALAALASSQITLAVLVFSGVTAGLAALIASVVGAAVSYLLSRWAWERKGKPDLLRETLPFWLVSLGAWGFLSLVSHFAGAWAKNAGLDHLQKVAVVNGAYLLANCVTFVTRFLIFHYVLFKNRDHQVAAMPELAIAEASAGAEEPGSMTLAGDSSAQARERR